MPPTRGLHILLHIGTEKTGTTTLQRSLLNNNSALRLAGIHYLAPPKAMNARMLAAAVLCDDIGDDYFSLNGIHGTEARKAFQEKVRAFVNNTFASIPPNVHTVVISSEHFHSRLRRPIQVARLHHMLRPWATSFRVVCYLRRQVDLVTSYYSSELKNGGTRSLQEMVRTVCRPTGAYCDYEGLLNRWAEIFGEESVTPALFSSAEWHDGDLLQDFVIRSGIKESAPGLTLKATAVQNESVTPEGQALLLTLNRLAALSSKEEARRPTWQKLRREIARIFAGKGASLPRAEAEGYQLAFEERNVEVLRRWFPERERLFDTLPANYGTPTADLRVLDVLDKPLRQLAADRNCRTATAARNRCVELLRDAALQLESSDLIQAESLMTKAQHLRPNGPLINRKLVHYRQCIAQSTTAVARNET